MRPAPFAESPDPDCSLTLAVARTKAYPQDGGPLLRAGPI